MTKKRAITATDMHDHVQRVQKLRTAVVPPEMAMQQMSSFGGQPAPAAPVQEMLDGHCLACPREEGNKFKKHTFAVEGQEKMKNGAIRKYGKCPAGHQISHIVSGKQAA